MTEFRSRVCERMEFVPFPHQAEWWAASDGYVLTERKAEPGEGYQVRLPDMSTEWRAVEPRLHGRARVLADLGAFKAGKSKGGAMWATGFAAIPEARVSLVGLEYDICAPEFEYLCEALLSETGMNLRYDSLQNRPRDGRMWLDLPNGARFEARSWERKDTLKGKEIDCLPADAPIWMGDFSFKPIAEVRPGDEVIGWAPSRRERPRNGNWQKTARWGLVRTKVIATHKKRDRLLRLTLKSGKDVYCTPTHRWLSGGNWGKNRDYVTPKIGRALCHVIDQPRALTHAEQRIAAWLGGIYDGEGSRTLICQSPEKNPAVYSRIEDALHTLGFSTTRQRNGVRFTGGRQAALNFLTFTGRTRFAENYAADHILGARCIDAVDEIVAIEDLGEHEVYCLQTETENYVAYGYISHNCYVFCEAYMLPGIECYTGVAQNLRARKGYALFATTPDRPWVGELHERGHGALPDWHCTCSVPASVNPFTFDQAAMDRDDPDLGGLMTKERFAIAYLGRLGDYVGRVFNFQRGDSSYLFTPEKHPQLWVDPAKGATLANLRIPETWTVMGAADTGAFISGLFVAFDPDGNAYVLLEIPNYRYVAGEPEVDQQMSIPRWAMLTGGAMAQYRVRGLWADANSQFKRELMVHHDIRLLASAANLETRTEITREYLQARKVWLAPWLEVLPFELEVAQWPPEATATGKFARLKKHDHTLDCLEHILARRPRGYTVTPKPKLLWIEEFANRRLTDRGRRDPHLGRQ